MLRAAIALWSKDVFMRNLILGATAAATLFAGAFTVGATQAAPSGQLFSSVYTTGDSPELIQAQYIFGGRNYCWYDNGWRGPGFYSSGSASRRGFGWGGGAGWHGWQGHGGGRGGGHGVRSAAIAHGGHARGHAARGHGGRGHRH